MFKDERLEKILTTVAPFNEVPKYLHSELVARETIKAEGVARVESIKSASEVLNERIEKEEEE